MSNRKGISSLAFLGLVAALLVVVGTGIWVVLRTAKPHFDRNQYQAVLLSNGQVYFGHLDGFGSRFPVLTDVYYVQSAVNPQTREPNNILLKRGGEWHGPDRMVLNGSQIVLVEPVGQNSKVAQLIKELKAR